MLFKEILLFMAIKNYFFTIYYNQIHKNYHNQNLMRIRLNLSKQKSIIFDINYEKIGYLIVELWKIRNEVIIKNTKHHLKLF
jgi:hypothetical protein